MSQLSSLAESTPHRMPLRSMALRTRLLLAYGVIVCMSIALGIYLFHRINLIRDQTTMLSGNVATDVRHSVQALATVADAQRAVDQYLLQPDDASHRAALMRLEALDQTIRRLQGKAHNPALRDHMARLSRQILTYHEVFDQISANIAQQQVLNRELDTAFFAQYQAIETALANARPRTQYEYRSLDDLKRAGSRLQLAFVWMSRLKEKENELATQNALAALEDARARLKSYVVLNGSTGVVRMSDMERLGEVIDTVEQSSLRVRQLATLYKETAGLVEQRLKPQGILISAEASALTDTALLALNITTIELDQDATRTQVTGGGWLVGIIIAGVILGLVLAATITRPLNDLVAATGRLARGDEISALEPRGGRELILLAQSFNQMAEALHRERAEVQHQHELLTERARELEITLEQLHVEAAAREHLDVTVRQMSVPIIPLSRGVIVVPLVGEIDAARAETLQHRLLQGVVAERALVAILDITGVPMVDAQVSAWLLQAMGAVRLLGAHCILVGINPEVAQMLVASGVNLDSVTTRATLQEGLEYAMDRTRPQN